MGPESIDVATLAAVVATVAQHVVHVAAARPHPPDRRHRRRLDRRGGADGVVGARLDAVPRRRGLVVGGARGRCSTSPPTPLLVGCRGRAAVDRPVGRCSGRRCVGRRPRSGPAGWAVRRRSPRCSGSPTSCSSRRPSSRRGARGSPSGIATATWTLRLVESAMWGVVRLRPRRSAADRPRDPRRRREHGDPRPQGDHPQPAGGRRRCAALLVRPVTAAGRCDGGVGRCPSCGIRRRPPRSRWRRRSRAPSRGRWPTPVRRRGRRASSRPAAIIAAPRPRPRCSALTAMPRSWTAGSSGRSGNGRWRPRRGGDDGAGLVAHGEVARLPDRRRGRSARRRSACRDAAPPCAARRARRRHCRHAFPGHDR